MRYLSILLSLGFLTGSFSSVFAESSLFSAQDANIFVNNRVLAYVNGKAITVLDAMKKMDIYFLKQYPEYTSAPQARFQYYQISWRRILQELVDKELILADAKETKVPISAGDVRQEMELLFGPNIIANLDQIGLTFEEAFKIVEGDLLIRKMISYRVNNKALQNITPIVVREAYQEFAKNNLKKETWHYQVVTIRNNDPAIGAKTALQIHQLLTNGEISLDSLQDKLKEKGIDSTSSCTLSDALYHSEEDVAEALKTSLKELTPGSFSKPIVQKSRTDKSSMFRIIYLKEKVQAGAIPYNEIANQLKNELLDKAIAKESEAYLKKLRQHYAVPDTETTDMIPENFQPFQLK